MRVVRALPLFACVLLLNAHATEALDDAFERDVLVIAATAHACYRFDVYLAISHEQKQRGLMFVRELPTMTGMLFVYAAEDYHSMWMKNTYIPLDILFARRDGLVVSIARETEPQSLESIGPTEPVTWVLELNGGVSEQLGIGVGSVLMPDLDLQNEE